MESPAFYVWSTVLVILMVVITIIVTLLTIKGLITGKVVGLDHGWRTTPLDMNGDANRYKEA